MARDDDQRFDALARAVHEPVLRYLLRRADPDTAADVLADTLTVLWRRLEDVPPQDGDGSPGAALAWCYAVARNCLANARRGARRHHALVARIALLDPPPSATPEAPAAEDPVELVGWALARLPEHDAELLRLWAWEQLQPREIATVLGITPNAASIRLHRAKARLRTAMSTDRQDLDRQDPSRAGHNRSAGGDRS